MDPGIAKHVGAGLLAEVEEESLEMVCLPFYLLYFSI